MNLLAEVQREHSKAVCDRIVRYVGGRPDRFRELIAIFLAGPYRVTQRASWPISCCIEHHPELIQPHLSRLLTYLRRPGLHDAVKRNIVRLMQFIRIPSRLQGKAADVCFRFLQDTSEPTAVRCFSMTVLGNLAKEQPGLATELKIIIDDIMPYATSGMAARARRTLKSLGARH